MKRFTAFACLAALVPVAACATTSTTTTYRSVPEDDYRISVEIPLDGTEFADEQILRVNELLDERTEFDSSDFQLDEVVLVARSEAETSDSGRRRPGRTPGSRVALRRVRHPGRQRRRLVRGPYPRSRRGSGRRMAPRRDRRRRGGLPGRGDGAAAARRRGKNGLPHAHGLPHRRRSSLRLPELLDLRPDPLLRLSLLRRPLAVSLLHRGLGLPLLPCRLPAALSPVRRLPRPALRHRRLARPLPSGPSPLSARSRCPRVEARWCWRRPTSGALRRSQAQQRTPADVPRPGRDCDGHAGADRASR